MWPYYWNSPLKLFSALLHGGKLFMDWLQFKGKDVILTHLSRISIVLAYRLLHLLPGDEVLVPSYNCGSEIDPLLWCGAKTVFYRVDSCAKIDPEDIQSRLTPKTRALYVTHYFGWPQNLSELVKWCRERNLFLIEDCALSLFSRGPEGPLGCMGDAAVHCFWKTLPAPDGGALTLPKNSVEIDVKLRYPDFSVSLRGMQPFLKRWSRNTGKRYKRYLGPTYRLLKKFHRPIRDDIPVQSLKEEESAFPDMPSNYYFDEKINNWTISRLSRGILNQSNPEEIVQIRKRNYKQLLETIHDLPGVQPLFDGLPEGVCPLVMPVLVSDPYRWKMLLNKRNIFPIRWWNGYHRSLSWDSFPEACKLKNHLLAFHVDQYLDECHIKYVADNIKAVAYEYR